MFDGRKVLWVAGGRGAVLSVLLLLVVACGPGHTTPDERAPVKGVTKAACWDAGLHAVYVDLGTWSGSGQIICVESIDPYTHNAEEG